MESAVRVDNNSDGLAVLNIHFPAIDARGVPTSAPSEALSIKTKIGQHYEMHVHGFYYHKRTTRDNFKIHGGARVRVGGGHSSPENLALSLQSSPPPPTHRPLCAAVSLLATPLSIVSLTTFNTLYIRD